MFPLIFGAAFVLPGALGVWLAVRTFAKDRAIARWPRAPGKLTSSEIKTYTGKSRDRDGLDREYTSYTLVVRYTYTVDGCELEGDRVDRAGMSSSQEPDLGRYAVGSDVLVYYDPRHPETAYLEVRRSTGAVILAAFGGVLIFIGVLVPTLVLLC